MIPLALVVLSVIIVVLLARLNFLLALLFFFLAIVTLPAVAIQRREATAEKPLDTDSESTAMGGIRLLSIIGLDTTGIALAVLIIIAAVLIARGIAVH